MFDSGFGGLHVLAGLVKEMPAYNYVYLGDSARIPYGKRSQEEIYVFTKQAVDFLHRKNCDLIIIACNSASSEALSRIQKEHIIHARHRRVLGVLVPSAEEAVAVTKNGRIGVIATEATVRSGAYEREIKKLVSLAEVFSYACPLLVPLVEEGLDVSRIAAATVNGSLKPILKHRVDTLVLGCTHYGILEPLIRTAIGDTPIIISQQQIIPPKLVDYLARHPEIESRLAKDSVRIFYTTDTTDKFSRLGSRFFGGVINSHLIALP